MYFLCHMTLKFTGHVSTLLDGRLEVHLGCKQSCYDSCWKFCFGNHPNLEWMLKCHSFISGMHHYECIVPNVDINLQSGRFWAKSIALFRERLNDSRSCWILSSSMWCEGVLVVSSSSPGVGGSRGGLKRRPLKLKPSVLVCKWVGVDSAVMLHDCGLLIWKFYCC